MNEIRVSRSELTRTVVAMDPAVTATETSDDTGIIVVARGPHIDIPGKECTIPFCPGHGYVLADYTCHELPVDACKRAVQAYDDFKADRIVAEKNAGGDYIRTVIHTVRAGVPFSVVTATVGKKTRAEPAAALSEQNRVHFLGVFPELEQQLTTWNPEMKGDSPDRLDALVWGLTYLNLVGDVGAGFLVAWQQETEDRPAQAPEELRALPRAASDAPAELRSGCKHRYQQWPTGIQCVLCGGWKIE